MSASAALALAACLNVAVGAPFWSAMNVHPPGTRHVWLRCLAVLLFWLPVLLASLVAGWWRGGDGEDDQ